MPRGQPTTIAEFWSRVERSPGCWEWKGGCLNNGYGRYSYDGRIWRVHRLAWMFTHGKLPDGLLVIHSCDNRLCVNPDHLRLGTHLDNSADALARGRTAHGERTNIAKRSKRDVRWVKRLHEKGLTTSEILRVTGLGRASVRDIIAGRIWRRVEPDPPVVVESCEMKNGHAVLAATREEDGVVWSWALGTQEHRMGPFLVDEAATLLRDALLRLYPIEGGSK